MKKLTLITTILFLVLFSFNMQSQKFSGLDKSPMDVASYPSIHDDPDTQIKIIYSRPQLKGRALDELITDGKVWRTGANEATVIILYKDMKMGKELVKAGTYSLATIPGKKEWVIILNSDINVWGAYSYKEENDVARLTVPVTQGVEVVEALSIILEENEKGVNMVLGWGTLRISTPFTN
jgi:hypothetical protein